VPGVFRVIEPPAPGPAVVLVIRAREPTAICGADMVNDPALPLLVSVEEVLIL
jgi:hypothetical protein